MKENTKTLWQKLANLSDSAVTDKDDPSKKESHKLIIFFSFSSGFFFRNVGILSSNKKHFLD